MAIRTPKSTLVTLALDPVGRAITDRTPLEHHRVMTLNICCGGFAALLAKTPRPDDEMKCTVRLPGGERIETAAKAVGSKPQGGSTNVSFAFGKLADADRERLEMLVFDIALEQLAAR
jgi:hypothetical protein